MIDAQRRAQILAANDAHLRPLLDALLAALPAMPNARLLAVIQFGSTVRQPLKRETDIDLVLVFDRLPADRWQRSDLFLPIERSLAPQLAQLRAAGYAVVLSPILKTREEFLRFSNVYLDFPDEAVIRYDPDGLARTLVDRVAAWIRQTGAYRVVKGLKWYWVLKPDLKPGEEFEIGFKE